MTYGTRNCSNHGPFGMGSWFSSAVNTVIGKPIAWAESGGNIPGTPTTRKYGYDPTAVAKAVTADLQAPVNVGPSNQQGELIIAGIAGLGLLLLLKPSKKRGR